MLSALFWKVLSMSAAASVAILAVSLARIPLKFFPKVLSYALWLVVLIRLLCPVSIPAPFSLVPDTESLVRDLAAWEEADGAWENVPKETDWDSAEEGAAEGIHGTPAGPDGLDVQDVPDGEGHSGKKAWRGVLLTAGKYIWLAGAVGLPAYELAGVLRLKRGVRDAQRLRGSIYTAKNIRSPFTLGLLRPKIYLPEGLDDKTREFVILHEQHHIQRLDHVFKALGFLVLSIHWFNPLVWLTFALASADMEMSCDEAVVRALGDDVRADYCASLLSMASDSKIFVRLPKKNERS